MPAGARRDAPSSPPAAPGDAPSAAAGLTGARGVHLHYTFAAGEQTGAGIGNALFDLLNALRQHGSITHAARALGCSYRYAWGALRQWESALGDALVVWQRGQPARLTPFAERLLWSERRARSRIQPQLEALRADLARVLADARDERQQLLTVFASHDLALPRLQRHAADAAALHLDIRFEASSDCLRSLNAGQCQVAGFHVPALRGAAPVYARAIKPLLRPGRHKLIGCARRVQGLMLRAEHAGRVGTLAELVRSPLRFVNRQEGSGTRLLLDHLLREQGLAADALPGWHGVVERSHVAVAASIAAGAADVGPGIEAAAVEFGLHFVPLVDEDYYLVCLKTSLASPAVQRLCALLAGAPWRDILLRLPGYAPAPAAGAVLRMTEALPWWRYLRAKPGRGA